MQITEVRIKLMEGGDDRLQAFCSITFDDAFVVRDLKIIEGANGPFVAMPSRKLTSHCPHCRCKNHLRAAYCNQCGARLKEDRAVKDAEGRYKLYADIAHPVNSLCREMIQERVIAEFANELERSKLPGYVSRYDDDLHDDAGEDHPLPPPLRAEAPAAPIAPALPVAPAAALPAPIATTPLDRPQVQPPEPNIRPPHKAPAKPSSPLPRRDDGFGQGIF